MKNKVIYKASDYVPYELLEWVKMKEWERIGHSKDFYLPQEGVKLILYLLEPLWRKFEKPKFFIDDKQFVEGIHSTNPIIRDNVKASFYYGGNNSFIILKLNDKNKISLEALLHEIIHYCRYCSGILTLSSNKDVEEEETELITDLIFRPLKSIVYELIRAYDAYLTVREMNFKFPEYPLWKINSSYKRLFDNSLKIFILLLSKKDGTDS